MAKYIVTLNVLVEADNIEDAECAVNDAYFYGLSDAYGKNDNVNMQKISTSAEVKYD